MRDFEWSKNLSCPYSDNAGPTCKLIISRGLSTARGRENDGVKSVSCRDTSCEKIARDVQRPLFDGGGGYGHRRVVPRVGNLVDLESCDQNRGSTPESPLLPVYAPCEPRALSPHRLCIPRATPGSPLLPVYAPCEPKALSLHRLCLPEPRLDPLAFPSVHCASPKHLAHTSSASPERNQPLKVKAVAFLSLSHDTKREATDSGSKHATVWSVNRPFPTNKAIKIRLPPA